MTNEECRGYAVVAMEEAGVDQMTIRVVYHIMHGIFDRYTEEEAEIMADKLLSTVDKR